MTAVDTNVLVYAHSQVFPLHAEAKELVTRLAEGEEPWAIAHHSLVEFLATVTSPRFTAIPSPTSVAVEQVRAWSASPSLNVLYDVPISLGILLELVERKKTSGPRIHDLRIAATCMSHGVQTFLSTDRDFRQFTDIDCRNPFATR